MPNQVNAMYSVWVIHTHGWGHWTQASGKWTRGGQLVLLKQSTHYDMILFIMISCVPKFQSVTRLQSSINAASQLRNRVICWAGRSIFSRARAMSLQSDLVVSVICVCVCRGRGKQGCDICVKYWWIMCWPCQYWTTNCLADYFSYCQGFSRSEPFWEILQPEPQLVKRHKGFMRSSLIPAGVSRNSL